jgi:hypothetical protein
MSKEEIIDYVMTTPSNPNKAVLSGMLDEVGGTQLPSPTASDNGKVLGVDNGEYKLVEQSGNSSALVVNIVADKGSSGQDIKRLDVTARQLIDAYEQGTIVEYRGVESSEFEGVIYKMIIPYAFTEAEYSVSGESFGVMLTNENSTPKFISLNAYSANEYPSDEEREDEGGGDQN